MGCSTSNSQQTRVLPRNLPGPPSYLHPVEVKDPALGEDPYIIAARERAGRLKANGRIIGGRAAWIDMKTDYANPQ